MTNDHRGAHPRRPSLRDGNLAAVLGAVVRAPEPPSRARVAVATGLTRSTVSRLVDELLACGLLDELEPVSAPGRGRPGTPLAPGGDVAALGLQVNPGYLAVRAVDLRGRVIAERYVDRDLAGSNPRATLTDLAHVADGLRQSLPLELRLVGCGLALPGIVSVAEGQVLSAPNLGWADVAVAELLDATSLADLPLRVGNEADLAARTVVERTPGGTGRLTDFVYVSGEVGIGGAAVVDSRVFPGRRGWAGEIGHVTVDPDGPTCRCGSTGCLELYAGRRAMLRAAGLPPGAAVVELLELVRAGDPTAVAALNRAVTALGVALSSTVNVLDIPTIVLGGHLAEAAEAVREPLVRELARRVLSARWQAPTVEVAEEGAAPGATGAAYLVLDRLIERPAAWLDQVGVVR